LKAGGDTVTLSHLLGHREPSMVSRVYRHVQQDPIHKAPATRRAKARAGRISPESAVAIFLRDKDLGERIKGPCNWHRLAPRDQLPCPLSCHQYTQ
jgi:hypothetical protein